ncbi:MAG: hypothetical protein IT161_13515 [Bryobacterales bacterium]|nr:hypothetical protein [Bryobacterales bacterium]
MALGAAEMARRNHSAQNRPRGLWQCLKSIVAFQAPDPDVVGEVNQNLGARRQLSRTDWTNKAAEEANVPLETAEVLFEFLGRDKLDVGRIRVDDRIREDLRLDKVLWWDWDLDLYEEYVGRSLPVSRIRKGGAVAVIVTVRDLLRFLAEARSPSG